MIKRTSDPHPNVHIENEQIKRVYECKTLGVTIDKYLSWKSNTENICKKFVAESLLSVESNLMLTKNSYFLI